MAVRAARPPDSVRESEGFTLLEVLIALVILSVALATLLGIFSQSLSRARDMRENVAARALTQSLLAEQGAASPIVIGDTDGEAGAFAWRLHADPYGSQEPGVPRMVLLTANVTWDHGKRALSLTTLRLMPKESQR